MKCLFCSSLSQQNKATGLVKMDELTKQYKEYEEVVIEHRAMKERQRLKAEQEERERKAAIRVRNSCCESVSNYQ